MLALLRLFCFFLFFSSWRSGQCQDECLWACTSQSVNERHSCIGGRWTCRCVNLSALAATFGRFLLLFAALGVCRFRPSVAHTLANIQCRSVHLKCAKLFAVNVQQCRPLVLLPVTEHLHGSGTSFRTHPATNDEHKRAH